MKRYFFLLLAGLMVIGCRKNNTPGTEPGTDPGNEIPVGIPSITEIGQPKGNAIQKVIGTGGGTITSTDGKISLVIPSGALENNQTISIQPIESTVPNGLLNASYRFAPHGLQFKKPVQLTLKYTDAGSDDQFSPELLYLATQQQNGSWQVVQNITIDKTAKTATVSIQHFSDYDFFLQYELASSKGAGDTIKLHTTENADFFIKKAEPVKINEKTGDVFISVPMPISSGEVSVREWAINSTVNPPSESDYGWFDSLQMPDRLKAYYHAPRKVPTRKLIAISAKMSFPKKKGEFFLVANVLPVDNNKLEINGVNYKPLPVAQVINNFLAFTLNDTSYHSPKYVALNVQIPHFNGPGTYSFSKDNIVTAADPNQRYVHSKFNPDGSYTYGPGTITVTRGRNKGDFFMATVNGTLRVEDNSEKTVNVKGIIEVKMD